MATARSLSELYISPNFRLQELTCKCGCRGLLVSEYLGELVGALQRFRELVGPVLITSAYRCATHNAQVGGKRKSWHLQAAAADLVVPGRRPADLVALARKAGFKEIVVEGDPQTGWLHVAVKD